MRGMRMKKIISLLLILVMSMVTITACASTKKTSLVVLDESLQAEEYAIAFKKGNTQLHNAVMSAFDDIIADGTAANISTKWFGKDILVKGTAVEKAKFPEGKKTLVMGLDDSFPPMGYRDESNNIVGFDVDLAKAVAKKLGVELVLQPIDWSAKELELSSGNIDCIWNGLTRTADREKEMLLSRTYLANNQVIVVKEGSGIKAKANLSGKKVGVQTGSSAEEALGKDAIASQVKETVQYADNVTALQDLKIGRINAVVLDEIVARYYISTQNNK
jgi:ABC-type amino acid transport substrate-binding protein